MPKIGDAVIYVDEYSKSNNAIVTAVHGDDRFACINLVYVSLDLAKTDSFGRQIERANSVSHKNPPHTAYGRYWEYVDEPPTPEELARTINGG